MHGVHVRVSNGALFFMGALQIGKHHLKDELGLSPVKMDILMYQISVSINISTMLRLKGLKGWSKWWSWAVFFYNNSFPSNTSKTSFWSNVWSSNCSSHSILRQDSEVRACTTEFLWDRDHIYSPFVIPLKGFNHDWWDSREPNKPRWHVEFLAEDEVHNKVHPLHRAFSAVANRKLAPSFFGPFEVKTRISAWCDIWSCRRVHPTFHVSLLKPAAIHQRLTLH